MPDRPHPPRITFVDDPRDVADALHEIQADVVGVDVERADAERYFRRAALVQVGVDGGCALLDGVTIPTMPELDAFLGPQRVAVFHAVQNDLEPLAAKGVVPDRPADTAVAAAMLGLRTGLGPLLAEVLGIELEADKARLQRADWEARPLSHEMKAYATGDVVHLPRLWAELSRRLADRQRTAWYDQELASTLARARDGSRHWTRVKGAGLLSEHERAVLRSVWLERERLAREHDVAPNRLLHEDVLRDIATDPPRTAAQLVRRSQRRRALLRQHATDLLASVERGLRAAPEPRPSSGRRWSDADRSLFDELRRTRADVANELGIDPGVLCPSRPLWTVIAGEPADRGELCTLAGFRDWQAEQLATPLWETYATHRDGASA